MGKYFTNIPICPYCFSPTENDNLEQLYINKHIFKCNSCGCYFRDNIKINQNNNLNFTFPLFNEVKLNKIESSYADWVLNEMNGKFLITWPWNIVKFIPILLSQFLLKDSKNKIVVFTDSKYFKNNLFSDESLPNILNSLFYVNSAMETDTFEDKITIEDIFMKYPSFIEPTINDNINNSFFNCLENKYELFQCFNDNYAFINSIDGFNIKTKKSQIIFIDESKLSRDMVEVIMELNPDLIVSTNVDALWGDRWGKRNPIFKLFALDCNILLFSVDMVSRSSHNIGREDYFLKNWGIIPHTWDYSLILDKIEKMDDKQSSFCSSSFDDIQNFESNLKINLIECSILEKIESTFELFNELFPYDKMVIRTLEDLMKTPLHIKGLYEDKRVLDRNITFEYLFNIVYNLNLDKWEELIKIFDEVYDFHGDGRNPIANLLIDCIKDKNLLDDEIVVIVHHYDIDGTKLILNDELGDNNIIVTSWSRLNKDIEDKQISYAISTLFPPTTYNLLSSPLNNLEIICSPRNMVRFDVYKMNRMTENGLKPIHILDNDDNAPDLLKECLKGLEIPQDYHDKINKVHEFGFNYKNIRERQFYYSKFRKNDDALLVLNEYGQGMFLKFNTVIYILDQDNKMKDSEIKYGDIPDLEKKQLLINNGSYQSIGRLFFKFVIENGSEISLDEDVFKWRGFKDLIESMFSWVDLLNRVVNIEANNHLMDYDFAKSIVAKELSQLGLTAFHEDYIINNWLQKPQPLETKCGVIQIYEAEKLKTEDDVSKIYEWVSENYPEFSQTNLAARKSFAAGRKLKSIRRDFINLSSSNSNHEIRNLNLEFRKFIKNEKELFDTFIINDVKKVKIKKEASPFVIINNPGIYIKE